MALPVAGGFLKISSRVDKISSRPDYFGCRLNFFCVRLHLENYKDQREREYMRMKEEEQNIIRLLKQGHNAAYKYIYDHHYTLLCSISYEYLKDDFLAETIADDTIFHLWERRDYLDITTSLRSYLVRAVRNRSINHLNMERERREVSFSSLDMNEENLNYYSEEIEYPLAVLLENELENKIIQAIENLPEDCRKVFKMSRFEEKRYDQIADELGISVNTVKYHIKNALSRLNGDLSQYLIVLFYFWMFVQ